MNPLYWSTGLLWAALIASAEAGPREDVTAWWPDTEVVTAKMEQHWAKIAADQKSRLGAVSPSVSRHLEHAQVMHKLPKTEQEVLLALTNQGSFPWIRHRKLADGTSTVISIDLSGRSQRIDGPELQSKLAVKVGNEAVSKLDGLANLGAVFAFDTLVDDAGLASLVRIGHLRVLWVPPQTTDVGLNALAVSKELEWLCLIGCEAKCTSLAAWRAQGRLKTLYLTNLTEAQTVLQQAKLLPSLQKLIYRGSDLLNAKSKE